MLNTCLSSILKTITYICSLVEVDRLDRLMAASVEKCSDADERPLSLHSSTMFPSQSNVKMSLDECSLNMYKGATLFMTQFLHQLVPPHPLLTTFFNQLGDWGCAHLLTVYLSFSFWPLLPVLDRHEPTTPLFSGHWIILQDFYSSTPRRKSKLQYI